jgi:hypothetical protein
MPEERSSGSLQVVKAGRSYAEVLHSPSSEAVVSVGPKLFSSQEIDLLPMANRAELVVCAVWDCSEEENGCSVPPQVKAAALGRRKMRKCLGFLSLGLGLGKLGLGFPRFCFRVKRVPVQVFGSRSVRVLVGPFGWAGFRVKRVFLP